MSDEELCIHEMVPAQCSICLHGPTPRGEEADEERHVSVCSSCGAEILWVETEKGRRMPLDYEPNPVNGRFIKAARHVDEDGKVHKIVHYVKNSELEANTKPLYSTHFETCPNADQHRSKK